MVEKIDTTHPILAFSGLRRLSSHNDSPSEIAKQYEEKNSYHLYYPSDERRVKFLDDPKFYYPASIVHIANRHFIVGEGPNKDNIDDLKHMIAKLDVKLIITLGEPEEGYVQKFERFWQSGLEIGQPYQSIVRYWNGVKQIQLPHWKDRKAAPLKAVLWLADQLEYVEGNIFIHGSAGIGRPGTLLALYALKKYQRPTLKDCVRVVRRLREQRHGCVYSYEQFELLYTYIKEKRAKRY